MVRRVCDRSFNAKSMEDCDEMEVIRGSELRDNADQAALKFLCGDSSRSVTDEHMETFDSMEALLREMNHAPSIEMPEFDASNVSDWLSKVERSFRVRRYSDLDKLDLVAFSLEGDALLWFDSEMTRSQFHSWDEFRHRLFLRFAAPPEASSETVTESLEARASYQVPVSSLEPGLSFSSESLVVSEAWQSDMVSINRVQSQFGLACVKNMNNAHRVFDELSHRRVKCQQRKKLSLSPKSRMFKFKNKTLLSNWSQMDLLQVIDISNVTNSYPCFSADFGFVRKKRTFQCLRLRNLRLHKQAHMSRFLYPMRMLHDPGGMKQLLHGDMQSMFVCVREFASLLEVICVWAECMMHTTTVISAQLHSLFSCEVDTAENMSSGLSQHSQVWEPGGVLVDHVLVDWFMASTGYDRIVDGIRCLEIGVCSGIKQPIDSRRASRVWERGGLDISAELTDWLKKCYKGFEFLRLMRQLHKNDLQWVRRKDLEDLCVGHRNRWWGWLVFDRGKGVQTDMWTVKNIQREMFLLEKASDAPVDSLIVRIKIILSWGAALEKQIQWAEIKKLSLMYKELWFENNVGINTGVSELKWIMWSVRSNLVEAAKVNVNSETRHGVCIILIFKGEPKLEGNHEMRGLLGISRSCFGDTGSVLVMVLYFNLDGKKWYTKRQQTSSSTWHRWRRKD